jgi:hypothetical protein
MSCSRRRPAADSGSAAGTWPGRAAGSAQYEARTSHNNLLEQELAAGLRRAVD